MPAPCPTTLELLPLFPSRCKAHPAPAESPGLALAQSTGGKARSHRHPFLPPLLTQPSVLPPASVLGKPVQRADNESTLCRKSPGPDQQLLSVVLPRHSAGSPSP